MIRVAALYVRPDGPYAGRADVDLWDESRDARLYAGPWPVVAHPPCQRWGNLWWSDGSTEPGNDGGCFAAAMESVRLWGGVLEHPEGSRAWAAFRLPRPRFGVGWTADLFGGWVCSVDQGRYGHPARKRTWLYYAGKPPPTLDWRNGATGVWVCSGPGGQTAEERRAKGIRLMVDTTAGKDARDKTPSAFAEALIGIAGGSR